jgi:hypothetical protein
LPDFETRDSARSGVQLPGGGNNSFMFLGSRLMVDYEADGVHFTHATRSGHSDDGLGWQWWPGDLVLPLGTDMEQPLGEVREPRAHGVCVAPRRRRVHRTVRHRVSSPPTQGRWLSPDPLAGNILNPQSLNRYAYVLNNPTSLVDPLGLDDKHGAPPCGGPSQISCDQYFKIIGPANCPAQFSSFYATLGGDHTRPCRRGTCARPGFS